MPFPHPTGHLLQPCLRPPPRELQLLTEGPRHGVWLGHVEDVSKVRGAFKNYILYNGYFSHPLFFRVFPKMKFSRSVIFTIFVLFALCH